MVLRYAFVASSPPAALPERPRWAPIPEGASCWDACSVSDLAQLRATSSVDAAFFLPLLSQALATRLLARSPRSAVAQYNAATRRAAVVALGCLGEGALPALPELLRLLAVEEEKDVLWAVAQSLGNIGVAAAAAVPGLVALLDSGACNIRMSATEALGKLGPEALAAAPNLADLLADEHEAVREHAAAALGKLAGSSAIGWLGKGWPQLAASLAAMLSIALEDDAWSVRLAAMGALGKLGAPAVPFLSKVLAEELEDEDVRAAAATALGELGDVAIEAAPVLAKALADDRWEVRAAAGAALGRLGSGAASARADIMFLLANADSGVRGKAVEVLGGFGEDVGPALFLLVGALADAEWSVRSATVAAFGKLSVVATPAVPRIVGLLMHEQWGVRYSAAEALGGLGPGAMSASQALEERARADDDFGVREVATEALVRITTNPIATSSPIS